MLELFLMPVGIVWIFLPGIVANITPVLVAKWWPAYSYPIWEWGLGAHKTWRGLITGVIASGLIGVLQWFAATRAGITVAAASLPTLGAALIFALALGLAALIGDATKSFIKRRLHIVPGQSWAPWDQIDFVLGMLVVAWFIQPLSLLEICVTLIVLGGGSFVASWFGVKFGLKKSL